MKSLMPPLMPSRETPLEKPPLDAAAAAAMEEAAEAVLLLVELLAALEKRVVPEERKPPLAPPPIEAEPPAEVAPDEPVPVPEALLSAEATAELAAEVVEEELEEVELAPPMPPPPEEIVMVMPPRPPPPLTCIPPPRPPRNCGATREAARSAAVAPVRRMVFSSVPRVTGEVFTRRGPPPPPPVRVWDNWLRKAYRPPPTSAMRSKANHNRRGPLGLGRAGWGTTSGRGVGSGWRRGCMVQTLTSGFGPIRLGLSHQGGTACVFIDDDPLPKVMLHLHKG